MRTSPTVSACLILALFAGGAAAQSVEPMPGSEQSVREAESVLPRVGTNETPVMPTRAMLSQSVEPGLTEGHDWAKVLAETLEHRVHPSTLAEGTFLLDRRGQLIKGPSGRLIFVPDRAERRTGEGPMLMLPCSVLDQLEQSWTGQHVLIRGEVFLYHGRNYLLPAWFTLTTDDAPASKEAAPAETIPDTESTATDDSSESSEPPASLEDDPQIRALLEELEAEMTQTRPGLDSPNQMHPELTATPAPARAKSTVTASGIREGTILMRRRGRLARQDDGAWALVFDHDEAVDLGVESLTILPCRMLMDMEALSAHDGGVRELIVSGRVYASKGDGYLLPTLIQRVRPQGISPRQ